MEEDKDTKSKGDKEGAVHVAFADLSLRFTQFFNVGTIEEAIGKRPDEVYQAEGNQQKLDSMATQCTATGATQKARMRLYSPNMPGLQLPSPRWFEVVVSPRFDAKNNITGAFAIFIDLGETTENLQEDSLLARVSQLEGLNVGLQTAKDEADSGRKIAEQTDRSKSEFLAMMSQYGLFCSLLLFADHAMLCVCCSEIRTPIHGILGTLELLSGTKLDSQQTDLTQIIDRSAHALLMIINGILDFSKIESGRIELEVKPFDIRATVEQVLQLLQTRAKAQRNTLSIIFGFDVPRVLAGDAGRLRQIVLNLVANACKFTADGLITVRVTVLKPGKVDRLRAQTQGAGLLKSPIAGRDKRPEESKGPIASSSIRIEVEDTGIGISRKDLGRIFTPFSQAESSDSRTYGGTGLGLAISERLVHVMHGQIGVVSTVDQGSTFWFDIPLQAANDDAEIPLFAASPSSILAIPHLLSELTSPELQDLVLRKGLSSPDAPHRMLLKTPESKQKQLVQQLAADQARYESFRLTAKVLVAEDNVINQKVLTRMLDKLQWAWDVANNGEEAVAKELKHGHRIILMDCQMPIKDGTAATADIRKIENADKSRPKAWIVAVTADGMSAYSICKRIELVDE
jgi:signal transduction histidine kinase